MENNTKLSPAKASINLKLIQLLILCVFLTFSSCKDDPVPPPPIDTTHYALEGTRWKLVAFVDMENNTSRPPEYFIPEEKEEYNKDSMINYAKNSRHYRLMFYPDSSCFGCGYLNYFGGKYSTDSNLLFLKGMSLGSEAGQLFDEELYIAALKFGHFTNDNVNEFKFEITGTNPEQLKLFYEDDKKYLLFEKNDYKWDWEE